MTGLSCSELPRPQSSSPSTIRAATNSASEDLLRERLQGQVALLQSLAAQDPFLHRDAAQRDLLAGRRGQGRIPKRGL